MRPVDAELDPLIHQRTRLKIIATLHRNREATFPDLREGLQLTAGNLHSHADRLVDAGYIERFRALLGTRFQTRYRITETGSAAFRAYLDELEVFVRGEDVPDAEPADVEGRPEGGADPRL